MSVLALQHSEREGDAPSDRVALLRVVLDHVAAADRTALDDAERAGERHGRRGVVRGTSLAQAISSVLVVRAHALDLLGTGTEERRRAEECFDRVLVGVARAFGGARIQSMAAGTRISPTAP